MKADIVKANVAMLRQGREGFGEIERNDELTRTRMVGKAKTEIDVRSQVIRIGTFRRIGGTGQDGGESPASLVRAWRKSSRGPPGGYSCSTL